MARVGYARREEGGGGPRSAVAVPLGTVVLAVAQLADDLAVWVGGDSVGSRI